MIKNFKYMWKYHRAFVILTLAYLIPTFGTYAVTQDISLGIGVGGLAILIASPFIWKYA